MRTLCSFVSFFHQEKRWREKKNVKRKKRRNKHRNILACRIADYDYEIFYTLSPLHLPTSKAILVAKCLCYLFNAIFFAMLSSL